MPVRFLGANIGDCPHTEGLYKAARLAQMAGLETTVCKVGSTQNEILAEIASFDPEYIGFSYRLTPEKGFMELKQILRLMEKNGLLRNAEGHERKIAFAGLPGTISLVLAHQREMPCKIFTFAQVKSPVDQVKMVLDFFDVDRLRQQNILHELSEELSPPSIKLLDQLAHEVVDKDNYKSISPLPLPSEDAKNSLIKRMQESKIPLLRSHFGVPSDTITPTVEGIKALAEARVIDEISLGSSDLSQRYYGDPDAFKGRKNDGGVPYKNKNDLKELYMASRRGNFPSVKPYAHVTNLLGFIDECIDVGMLKGAHQAIPLFWFNELDGRGPTKVDVSIKEHISAVKKLAGLNLPVEMNDPNQWSSRWAHDTIIATDYALISAVMAENGVKNMILQMQFNKPSETSDYGDLAKFKTGTSLAQKMVSASGKAATIHHETRTGIEHFSTDLEYAKWQLARSTLLQMYLNPSIIHVVSYCEAVHAATVEDIIESSKIIRRAVQIFRDHEAELRKYEQDPLVLERTDFLKSEAEILIEAIAKLDASYTKSTPITKYLSNPTTLFSAIDKGYVAAPGIVHPSYKSESLVTKPMDNGFFNAVDNETGGVLLERERLAKLQ